jgi:hypothetical protein
MKVDHSPAQSSVLSKLAPGHLLSWANQRFWIPFHTSVNTSTRKSIRLTRAWAASASSNSPKGISANYAVLNRELHESNPSYGTHGCQWAPKVEELARKFNGKDVLDYGCGKQTLAKALASSNLQVNGYDPAVPGLMKRPTPCDVVVCTDVLEHVEPEFIDNVLDDLARCTIKVALVTVATRPALKILADGRNAHLTVQPFAWWQQRFENRFDIVEINELPNFEFSLVLQPLGSRKA